MQIVAIYDEDETPPTHLVVGTGPGLQDDVQVTTASSQGTSDEHEHNLIRFVTVIEYGIVIMVYSKELLREIEQRKVGDQKG